MPASASRSRPPGVIRSDVQGSSNVVAHVRLEPRRADGLGHARAHRLDRRAADEGRGEADARLPAVDVDAGDDAEVDHRKHRQLGVGDAARAPPRPRARLACGSLTRPPPGLQPAHHRHLGVLLGEGLASAGRGGRRAPAPRAAARRARARPSSSTAPRANVRTSSPNGTGRTPRATQLVLARRPARTARARRPRARRARPAGARRPSSSPDSRSSQARACSRW